jgi:Zn-dependent peptidase ImmA (M78 family)/transcriptional regulator with XRE-family HTH domain
MPQKSTVSLNPDVLKWLRESSGVSPEEASTYLGVSVDLVLQWERGEGDPTFSQIKEMARVYKRPSAAFFLPKAVRDRPLPSDFRSFSHVPPPLTKKTLLAIRKARDLQAISSVLMENVDIKTGADVVKASLLNDTTKIAHIERNKIGISLDEQFQWKSEYEAFNRWRESIEHRKISVFQFPMEEIRGLSLTDTLPYAILINSSDLIAARIFTLLHEYAHMLLHKPALCTPENPIRAGRGQDIERWCNNFAGAFLLPSEEIKQDFERFGIANYGRIAKKYRVSYSAVLTRLLVLELITWNLYESERNKLKQKEREKEQKQLEKELQKSEEETNDRAGGENLVRRASRERGETFVSLVRENSHKGFITHSDVLDYLNVKIEHLKELQI